MIDWFKKLVGVPVADYDATEGSSKRRPPTGRVYAEEAFLPNRKRQQVSSSTQDLYRNLGLAANAIRMHLNYNTQFSLQSDSGDEGFDDDFEALVAEWSKPENFDIAARHGRDSWARLLESGAVLDGDCGSLRLANGRLQAIPSDLIKNPDDRPNDNEWVEGVRVNPLTGRSVEYAIHRRTLFGRGTEFAKTVPAANLHLHAYLFRFAQVRGVSPLTSCINDLKDFYEGKELALAKMKVEQLFALAIYRDAAESPGHVTYPGDDEESEEVADQRGRYEVDFGKGPLFLDLDDGDKAQFLQSNSPGVNTREFLLLVAMMALKSLDIPFSFFNEAHTNFFGSKTAWLHYERSCQHKRDAGIAFQNWWLSWRAQLAIQSGELRIPRQVLNRFSLSHPWWEFFPQGMPWWKPAEEVKASGNAVAMGFNSPQRICRTIGTNFKRNIREIRKAYEIAAAEGVDLNFTLQKLADAEVVDGSDDDE